MESQRESKLEKQCCIDLHWIKGEVAKAKLMKTELKNKLAKLEDVIDEFTDIINHYTQ